MTPCRADWLAGVRLKFDLGGDMALKISSGAETEKKPDGKSTPGKITVKERYEIWPDQPLPDYDSAPALAFKATTLRDSKRSVYALVCDPKAPPRLDMIPALHRFDHRAMINVIDWDVIDWPQEGRRCPVLILPKPAGGKVLKGPKEERAPLSEDYVTRNFIQPVSEILKEIHGAGETHRAFRPDNLYFADPEEKTLAIGECFSAPPAVAQPIVFETLESSLSSPGGRGGGTAADDLYALGVCILALLIGRYPCNTMTDEAIIAQKLAVGSYTTVAQSYRVSLTIMEVLRGLLSDDVADRWSLEDLSLWLNGRRLSPKQPPLPIKATRPISIGGHGYVTARELANAMSKNWDDAIPMVLQGDLDGWLRRSLGDESRTEAMTMAKGLSPDEEPDRTLARAIVALDPEGPIRMRGFAATLGGFGTFGTVYFEDEEAKKLLGDTIRMGLPNFWLEQQSNLRPEMSHNAARLDRMRATLMRPAIGYGLERVLYELNPDLPCKSLFLERDYVPTLDYLLPAMERGAANREGDIKRLIDRDIAAYISAHYRRSVSGDLADIETDDKAAGATAEVRMLAMLQDSLARGKAFPALCRAAVVVLNPAVQKFHSKSTRKRMGQNLDKVARDGRLQALVAVVTNPAEVEQDKNGYLRATNNFTRSAVEMIKLRQNIKNQAKIALEVGGQISSGLAGIVAALICAISFAVRFA